MSRVSLPFPWCIAWLFVIFRRKEWMCHVGKEGKMKWKSFFQLPTAHFACELRDSDAFFLLRQTTDCFFFSSFDSSQQQKRQISWNCISFSHSFPSQTWRFAILTHACTKQKKNRKIRRNVSIWTVENQTEKFHVSNCEYILRKLSFH